MSGDCPRVGGELARELRAVRDEVLQAREKLLGARVKMPTMAEFYAKRNVFMTGGSGFLGRCIIEMLLRTCPDIGNIYVLLRTKKGVEPQDRAKEMVDVPLFDRLRAEQPNALDKLVVVPGDITQLQLGMSQEHQALLRKEVSVVFHVAASVRFDDPFQKAVFTNLRSTRELVELARGMPQLKVLVHVSTAYTNINQEVLEERVYAPHLDWRQVITLAETLDPASLRAMDLLGPKLMDFQPNTYTFTKALAEKLIDDVADELPVILVRPSIVCNTFKDPIPGWLDNLYGLGAFWAAAQKGVLRVIYHDEEDDIVFDSVPVDIVTKTTILASWARGLEHRIRTPADEADPKPVGVEVVHATVGSKIGASNKDMVWAASERGLRNSIAFPGIIRPPSYITTSSWPKYVVKVLYEHILFGIVMDTLARLTGQKPRAMKLYRALAVGWAAISPFNHQFSFDVVNQRFLQILMHPKDEENYCIMDFFTIRDSVDTFTAWCTDTIKGVCTYALKEEYDFEKGMELRKKLELAMKVYHGTLASLLGFALYCVF